MGGAHLRACAAESTLPAAQVRATAEKANACIAPRLTWQLGANTSLSLLSHYLLTGEPGYEKHRNTKLLR